MRRTHVLIIGAGPVGLLAALGLARAGVDVTILEARTGPTVGPHDIIYRWSTLPVLEKLGVLADMVSAGFTSRQWCLMVRNTGERLVFDLDLLADEVAHPYNLHLPQDKLSAIVLRHLDRHAHVTVEWDTRVRDAGQDGRGVAVSADTPHGRRMFQADWVVGADGAHSVIRRSLGLGFAGMTWQERLVSLDLEFDFSTLGYLSITYQLDPQHGALVAQVNREGLWRYVYAESRLLPEETVLGRIPAALKAVLPDGLDPRPSVWSAYRVHERAADRLRVGRVLLAGDAAHVTNPTGSLGLAGGLFDAFMLAQTLAAVIEGREADAALDRTYADDRRRFFRTVASPLSSDMMHLVFEPNQSSRLEAETEHYRRITSNPARQREFLLLSRDLEALPVV